MPNAWMHATMDLIAFGCSYFNLHKQKDKAHEILGSQHRNINHEWYQAFDMKVWTFDDPFPDWLRRAIQKVGNEEGADFAEEQMVSIAHEHLDRVWDYLSFWERKYWESFFIWVLFNPRVLQNWAGVDVVNSKILRLVGNQEIWEFCSELQFEYEKTMPVCKSGFKQ